MWAKDERWHVSLTIFMHEIMIFITFDSKVDSSRSPYKGYSKNNNSSSRQFNGWPIRYKEKKLECDCLYLIVPYTASWSYLYIFWWHNSCFVCKGILYIRFVLHKFRKGQMVWCIAWQVTFIWLPLAMSLAMFHWNMARDTWDVPRQGQSSNWLLGGGHLVGVVSFIECGPRIFESKNYLTVKPCKAGHSLWFT